MELYLCSPRGFCAGVVRAIKCVERSLELWGSPIYVKHEIVHNRHVVNRLKKMGAVFIEEIDQVPRGSILIFSAHGVSPQVREHAKSRNLRTIDATCGLVTKVHSAAKRFAKKGYKVILIGHKNHVEVIGTYGEAPESTYIVESTKDVPLLDFSRDQKLVYLTQTTLSLDDVVEIIEALQKRFPQIESLPSSSICYATTNRQQALGEIAQRMDLILVVGDPSSSNSNRLREVAINRNVKAYLINSEQEISLEWLKGVRKIGLTAGASTPENLVQKIIDRLQTLGVSKIIDFEFVVEDVEFQLPKELTLLES